MAFTTATAEAILKSLLGQNSSGIIPNCYLGLSSTVPNATGGNFTEPPVSAGYARALIGAANAPETWLMKVTGNTAANDKIIYQAESTAGWGEQIYIGAFNHPTDGVPMFYAPLTQPVDVPANYVPLFRVGQFTLTLV